MNIQKDRIPKFRKKRRTPEHDTDSYVHGHIMAIHGSQYGNLMSRNDFRPGRFQASFPSLMFWHLLVCVCIVLLIDSNNWLINCIPGSLMAFSANEGHSWMVWDGIG